ncbi:glycerol-3-phosphate dehydrogenase/oxidase [Nocardioides limicola]|uniref:glycerol-3-phosphate dehydrogenase/oxidase n=1 Tax=Nocardioides limicola TaxID=2803368 RepID=UPI00193AE6F8|nr:glycerol-3-phosphate dehydrogenase/oxidase [Nocardioides sp. DJM-14]
MTRIQAGLADLPDHVDVVVIGLGVTGAGIALDAVSRGLSVLAVDAHDLAFGTSRWSSKLVHGGLRYLAHGQLAVAHESAVERGILMGTTAPHLTRPLPMLLPLASSVPRLNGVLARAGMEGGNLLRVAARTPAGILPRPRRISAVEARHLIPALRPEGLRGAIVSWDGQLEDDARLVTTIARTAAEAGAHIRTRARAVRATGDTVVLADASGEEFEVSTRSTINATGVWADQLDDSIRLRPSRGTHLVLRAGTLPGIAHAVTAPVPGELARYVLVLPQPDGTIYVGLTDEPVTGPVPDVPEPTEPEIGFLLDVIGAAFTHSVRREDVVGAFAGLRPLLDSVVGAEDVTADISRKHAVLTADSGLVTVVGGKLTTYRQMAEDAVDAALAVSGQQAGPCVTATLPLSGAASRPRLARLTDHPRLVRRFGTDAALVLETARRVSGLSDEELLAPIGEELPATLAELIFGVTHEGASDVADLLDRRTRIGLIPADRDLAVDQAERALEIAGR